MFDGHLPQYASTIKNGKGHGGQSCTQCHGGDDTQSTRALAHVGLSGTPGADRCAACHTAAAASTLAGQHTTLGGFEVAMAARGLDLTAGGESANRYKAQCTKCHVANAAEQSACGTCHISVPATAGGGLLAGHAVWRKPSADNNCTACHGSRVKDEYYGQNAAIFGRNKAAFPADSPWKTATLAADVHKASGMTCVSCHKADEMHGVGAAAGQDRYSLDAVACTECHGAGKPDAAAFAAVGLHTAGHLESMACQVCHTQPYKNCFGCHTDVTATGTAYYHINDADPTLAARQAAAAAGTTVAPDALMTFRVGLAGRSDKGYPGAAAPYKYAVLRHVPVDKDTFAYSGTNQVDGLLTTVAAKPTWKFATPHAIQKATPIQSACTNCHGADYAKYWLADPQADALGWIGADYVADEQTANAPAKVSAPMSYTP